MMNMEKNYDPSSVESKWYEKWEKNGYFHAVPNPEKQPFCIVIPPPNITGKLHMGHALDNSIQDSLIRYKRMRGFETLWLPGTDHASIATEVKIVEQMAAEGLNKNDIGRDGFLDRAWKWREEYGTTIVKQLRKLGSSCDWERERFTMDKGCNRAVNKVFVDLYNRGLIYKGDRIINWCPECKTAISDAEVEYEEQDGFLWHICYPSPNGDYSITVATTRPETMIGDTAIAVNPEDPRYKDIIGKTVVIPCVGREIPIVADEYCEMDFGTGAVKITPAHDPNDFEVGRRLDLPVIRVLSDDGHMNELCGKYTGMDRYECRKVLVEDLKACGALVKIEPYKHNVGTCYRCHTTIEPIVSKQWFVSMKELTAPALEAVRNGTIRFVPERFDKTYFNWMENIRDWCISRQLWWGHRIPVFYCDTCGEVTASEEVLTACPKCGAPVRQDEDVLDTWFSSGMWPFSTLGYPDKTEELSYFYPTSVLVTGYDIITFWVSRMITFGLEVMKEEPFKTVFVHGLVRDSLGRKMSKSLGNGIDPLEIIAKYGADSLRFSLLTGNSAGNDMRFYWEKVEAARNFCNKIYNAARFVLMNIEDVSVKPVTECALEDTDKWMLNRLNEVIAQTTANMEGFELGLAAQKVYDFIWLEFCDWYVEMAKPRLYGEDAGKKETVASVLTFVLGQALKLLHPFMPFITEELYQRLPGHEETVMLCAWPEPDGRYNFAEESERIETLMELVRSVRNLRVEMDVPVSQRIDMILTVAEKDVTGFASLENEIKKLVGAEHVTACASYTAAKKDVHIACNGLDAYIPLASLVDIAKERERLQKQIDKAEGDYKRASSKLANAGFVSKAPAAVVEEERKKAANAKQIMQKLKNRLAGLADAE